MSKSGYDFLHSRGFLTEDVDGIYCGSEGGYQKRRYLIQKDGGANTTAKWTDITHFSPQKVLRDLAKEGYPDAMILKTKYIDK